jgi:class 3 adenylate cyclase
LQSLSEVNDPKGVLAELVKTRAREDATREILGLLIQSREDQFPVFDAILKHATRLCNAPIAGLFMADYTKRKYELVASLGAKPQFENAFRKDPPDLDPKQFAAALAMVEKRVVHVEDLASPTLYGANSDHRKVCTETEGIRTTLFVPLIWNDRSIGAVAVWRREVEPFREDEIALVETFAAQAVIAIENVRQFLALQAQLERQTLSAEVLDIISRSRADENPVFEKITQSVVRLCNAAMGYITVLNPTRTHVTIPAQFGARPQFAERLARFNVPVEETWIMAVDAALNRRVIRIEDLAQDPLYKEGNEYRVAMVDDEGMRSVLVVPLVSGELGLGCIFLYRREVQPFTDQEVDVVRAFAAQAVIAIENVRQFKALETLNAELGDRVEAQVGEIERMGKLKRFLPAAVADTVVSSGSEDMLKSHRALLGVLFCDIRGFTAFCETAEPEETIEVLQTYHEEMGKLINAHGAGVDHRMGDGIMVLFNDPVPCDDPAGDAVRLALAMQARMADLCKGWKRLGHRLGFGVGISLGYATVGMVGYEGRSDYTASGTAVNLAARLCDLAEDGEILLATRAAIAVEDDHPVEAAGEVLLKGIREPVEVFKLANVAAG